MMIQLKIITRPRCDHIITINCHNCYDIIHTTKGSDALRVPLFPAATIVIPDATALMIAVVSDVNWALQLGAVVTSGLLPKLRLIILAWFATAQSISDIIPENEPLPVLSKTWST